MNFSVALKLGRTSNLPTIWTNTLVGLAFSGTLFSWQLVLLACAAFSLFYFSGMYLNDIFDLGWDKKNKHDRPLVQGQAKFAEVIAYSMAFIALALILVMFSASNAGVSLLFAIVLLLFILLYDWKHKQWTVAAPFIMGACRSMVYLCAASLVVLWQLPLALILVALSMLLYIAGITALARAEHENKVASMLPLLLLFAPQAFVLSLGYTSTHCILAMLFSLAWTVRAVLHVHSEMSACVPKAVAALLAGITLIDAGFLFALDYFLAAWFCLFCFVLCLLLQKKIAAT